jgi:hypothetical protein
MLTHQSGAKVVEDYGCIDFNFICDTKVARNTDILYSAEAEHEES